MADQFEAELRMAETRRKIILRRLDDLWNKGKADSWPNPVMDYIMWMEHELSRELDGLENNLRGIRSNRQAVADG